MILLGITKEDKSQILIPHYYEYVIKKEDRLIVLSKNNHNHPIKEYPDIKHLSCFNLCSGIETTIYLSSYLGLYGIVNTK